MKDRLEEAMEDVGISTSELARRCNVKPAAVGQWLSGSTKSLKNENLFMAADALKIEARWLATGKGPKKKLPASFDKLLAMYSVAKPETLPMVNVSLEMACQIAISAIKKHGIEFANSKVPLTIIEAQDGAKQKRGDNN